MATFPDITPDFGASKKSSPKVRSVEFGSGYSQRAVFGINQDPKEWSLRWSYLTSTDADTIEDFLEARAGVEAFDWSPIDESSTYKWICKSWSKEMPFANAFNINAVFIEVFEP